MNLLIPVLTAPFFLMLLLGLVPDSQANRSRLTIRKLVMSIVGTACLLALGSAVVLLGGLLQPIYVLVIKASWSQHWELSFYYDSVTALMLCLVSFLGLVTCRFSVRYMDGEQAQGRYFKWMAFTIGAASLMVISGNLLMFLLAWFMTSIGLHQLLTHYHHRPAAVKAAWTKFAFSRLGDLLLLFAIILTVRVFGSQVIPDIIDKSKQLLLSPESITSQHAVICWLLVFGTAIKTVQIPFHAWLPETLETPTPVSALMHAGVVNAGGYLLIRVNPFLALEPMAMTTLAVIGTMTACIGVVVMATQTSVKRSLAYSTIAQMGFMMLQCGVGAFSAAMLHILAHSSYKAYAFLSSGTVDLQSQVSGQRISSHVSPGQKTAYMLVAIAYSTAVLVFISVLLQMNLMTKPGGLLLAYILVLALSSWSWKILLGHELKARVQGLASVAATCAASLGSFQLINYLVGDSVVSSSLTPSQAWLSMVIYLAFGLLFLLHLGIASGWRQAWLEKIRIHAASGFYFSSIYQRLFTNILAS